jgi:hypothetical protein
VTFSIQKRASGGATGQRHEEKGKVSGGRPDRGQDHSEQGPAERPHMILWPDEEQILQNPAEQEKKLYGMEIEETGGETDDRGGHGKNDIYREESTSQQKERQQEKTKGDAEEDFFEIDETLRLIFGWHGKTPLCTIV